MISCRLQCPVHLGAILSDKAIDLVDEAASSLRLAQESKPDELETLDREIITLQIELESLKKETDVFSVERRLKVEDDLKIRNKKLRTLLQSGKPVGPMV